MPRAFKFRLEKLLDLRRLREELARRDLALARKAVDGQNRLLAGLLGVEDEGKRALRSAKEKTIDMVRLRLLEGYLFSLERRIRREYDRLQELVLAELQKRRALTEALKGVRVLERYREKKVRAWRYEVDREERRFLDEVGQNQRSEVG